MKKLPFNVSIPNMILGISLLLFAFADLALAQTAISNVQVTNITTSSAVMTWTTSTASDSRIETQYGDVRARNSAMVTSHSLKLSGLKPGYTYSYRVGSRDRSGKIAYSSQGQFGTPNTDGEPAPQEPTPQPPAPQTPAPTPKPTVTPTPPPTAAPTPTPAPVSPTPPPPPPTGAGTNSKAFGIWTPSRFDSCTKAEHDSYYVVGPDGKRYPTWHPPVHRRADGSTCTFGHEHGQDPSGSLVWNQVKEYFAYDANGNGTIEASELAAAGMPFGYANEQLDIFSSLMMMRHESHIGHKISYANGEPDIGTDQFDNNATGGVVVPLKTASGSPKWTQSGVRCYHMAKVHQGTAGFDAFTSNLHEVYYFADCRSAMPQFNYKASMVKLNEFGKFGEFTRLCDAENDRTTIVKTGNNTAGFPGSTDSGARHILQRDCMEKHFLVPEGQWSSVAYEAWPANFYLEKADGSTLVDGVLLLFDSLDTIRYHRPGAPDNVGFMMDLCYEVLPNGNKARGGPCEYATNYGQIRDITWDDPRSPFIGVHRGTYFQPPNVYNGGGPTTYYTDPFGKGGRSTPFPGSIKQRVPASNTNYGTLGQTDPRVNMIRYSDGGRTVHAPN